MAPIRIIPDLSTTPLYMAVVMQTRDDPQLLALWCQYAIWQPIDAALSWHPDHTTWADRALLAPHIIDRLTRTLIDRGLLTAHATIPRWDLQQASWNAVLPYSNELRQRAGIPSFAPQQGELFGDRPEKRDAPPM